jgi:uncharacterized C2H2 Zn-finger protein
MATFQEVCNQDTVYQCDECKATFKAKEVKLQEAATNITMLTPPMPLIFIDKDDVIKMGGQKAEEGDQVLSCPRCEMVHLFGFNTYIV